ncbi:MAG TPA: hypothetical protein VL996_11100 [Methylocella sp.]|nr:hypothetical protein [Methylocella sp.]
MSFLVLALGIFLLLCGAYAIPTGYNIIDVERGWASFIAGSVAFSCGIVTLALGLILHRLSSLHRLLTSEKGLMPPERALSSGIPPEPSMPPAAVPPLAAAPPQAASFRNWPQRPVRSHLAAARNFLKSRKTVLPTVRGPSETDYAPQKAPPLSRNGWKTAQTTAEPPFEPGFDLPVEVPVTRAKDQADIPYAFAPEEEADRAWHIDDEPGLFDEDQTEKPQTGPPHREGYGHPEEAKAHFEPGINWPPETVSIETIIEEELFSEQDPALESRSEDGEPSPEVIEQASREITPPVEEENSVTGAVPEPPSEPSPSISGAGQGELAIVGQYESAGTSYVMYSDGSIEARTAHAVFHFKSMAELKTFLESDAQNSQG